MATTLGAGMSDPVLAGPGVARQSTAASGSTCPVPPGTGQPISVVSGDVPLPSLHPGAVGDRMDRTLAAGVRDRLHGAARDRVPDGADAHRRMAA